MTVSVAVPSGYYEKIWRQANPPSAGQGEKTPDAAALAELQAAEKKKIEELVAPLLPQREPGDAYAQVAVSVFNQFPDPPPKELSLQDNALAWLSQNSNTLGMSCLALIGLIVLRSIIRSVAGNADAPPQGHAMEMPSTLSLVADEAPGEPADDGPQGRLRRRVPIGPSLRDELADIVRDDPESAVTILRTWIGNAG